MGALFINRRPGGVTTGNGTPFGCRGCGAKRSFDDLIPIIGPQEGWSPLVSAMMRRRLYETMCSGLTAIGSEIHLSARICVSTLTAFVSNVVVRA